MATKKADLWDVDGFPGDPEPWVPADELVERVSLQEFWKEHFKALTKALPRYNTENIRDWTKVRNHYIAAGLRKNMAEDVADVYHEYRDMATSQSQAIQELIRKYPRIQMVLDRPGLW